MKFAEPLEIVCYLNRGRDTEKKVGRVLFDGEKYAYEIGDESFAHQVETILESSAHVPLGTEKNGISSIESVEIAPFTKDHLIVVTNQNLAKEYASIQVPWTLELDWGKMIMAYAGETKESA